MPKYIIDIPEDRITSDGKLRFMACVDSPLANWIYTGIFAEPFDRKAIEDEVWEFCMNTDWSWISEIDTKPLREYSYQEAKVKYEVWKKSKDVIHVGDEVRDKDLGDVGVVTYVNNSCCCVLWANGVVSEEARKSELRSTGRHFNITHEMLKKMKEHREKDGN